MNKSTKVIYRNPCPTEYSESFKRQVVSEVESGKLSKEEARRKYQIKGKSTVLNWCRKYGKLDKIKTKIKIMSQSESDKTQAQSAEIVSLKEKLAALEEALKYAELKNRGLEILIEIAGRDMGQDLKKILVSKCQPNQRRKKRKVKYRVSL